MWENDDYYTIEYEIGHWEYPFTIKKGDILEWDSEHMKIVSSATVLKYPKNSIEVINILVVELGYEISDTRLLVKLI